MRLVREKMNKLVVADADVLVALADEKDANYDKAKKISSWLLSRNYEIIFPNTAILEAITALKRGKNLPEKAHILNRQYQAGAFLIEFVDDEIQKKASLRFEKTISKKNTIFDAIVAEVAIKLKADYIFSFDNWYLKQGFKLAEVQK